MRRQDKYPDTETFKFYNANPHGKFSGDCAIRAICTVLGDSWEYTLSEMCKIGLKYGYVPTDDKVIARYMESRGWYKLKQPRKWDNTKYTGKEFCKLLMTNSGRKELGYQNFATSEVLANIGGHHIVAIMDGQVCDIWNSTDGCIGNVWMRAFKCIK